MSQIIVENLGKTFKVPVRQAGFVNSFKGFIRREHRMIEALKGISFNLDIETVLMTIDAAIPCGLLINELLSNAMKHAFPNEREGEISIALHTTNEEEIELRISDNGIGLPKDFDVRKTESLGLQLVFMLGEQQLGGTVELTGNQGTTFFIRFKDPYSQKRLSDV